MMIGDAVVHRKFGRGTIVEYRLFGVGIVLVDFGYGRMAVNERDLSFAPHGTTTPPRVEKEKQTSAPVQVPGPPEPVQQAPIAPGQASSEAEARKAIFAMRLGQVLESNVLDVSVGTSQILTLFRNVVGEARDHQRPAFVIVDGAWGGGKTHAVTMLQAVARQARFVTSSTIMDGESVALWSPMLLLARILDSIRFPEDGFGGNTGELLRSAKFQGNSSAIRAGRASALADTLDAIPSPAFDDPEALQVIEDFVSMALAKSPAQYFLGQRGYRSSPLPSLQVRAVVDRAEGFVQRVDEWARFSIAMGARGMLLVFDELDVEYASTSPNNNVNATRRARRDELIAAFRQLSSRRLPLVVAFSSAGSDADEAVHDLLANLGPAARHVASPNPTREQLQSLFRKIADLYARAYDVDRPLSDDVAIRDAVLDTYMAKQPRVVRHFVRMTIEALDVVTTHQTHPSTPRPTTPRRAVIVH